MPGISFLFKKGFHPSRIDNQKKLFIAEQKVDDQKQREKEAALEVAKEADIQSFEKLNGESFERDPRSSSLKFMYCQPNKNEKEKDKTRGNSSANESNEDLLVKSFYEKLNQSKSRSETADIQTAEPKYSEESNLIPSEPQQQQVMNKNNHQNNKKGNIYKDESKLNKLVGKRTQQGLSQVELEERYPCLKNAPTEGSFTRNIAIKHNPFNEVIRNVKCVRCGEWGHKAGERECALKDYNPHDWARQKQEDPLNYMHGDLTLEKQKLILKHGVAARMSAQAMAQGHDIVYSDEDGMIL